MQLFRAHLARVQSTEHTLNKGYRLQPLESLKASDTLGGLSLWGVGGCWSWSRFLRRWVVGVVAWGCLWGKKGCFFGGYTISGHSPSSLLPCHASTPYFSFD